MEPDRFVVRRSLARVIAVVGCDGAGKSRLTADLLAQLGRDRPAALLYLGQSSGNILDQVHRVPLIGHAVGRYLVRRSERTHAENRPDAPPAPMPALVFHLLSLRRYRQFRRLLARDRHGAVTITDRYPQAEVDGFYFDGPGFAASDSGAHVLRWVGRREQRLYRRMAAHVPALVIRLNVDAATAHARKPDHRLSMLRDKVRVIPTLRFNGARILDLDGRSPYPEVLAAALAEARRVLPQAE